MPKKKDKKLAKRIKTALRKNKSKGTTQAEDYSLCDKNNIETKDSNKASRNDLE